MTGQQLKDLQYNQSQGAQSPIYEEGKEAEYAPEEHEKHLIHVKLELKSFSAATGEKTSTPYLQKFSPQEFDQAKSARIFEGYSVDILHKPTGYKAEKGTEKAAESGDNSATATEGTLTPKQKLQAEYEAVIGEKPADAMTMVQLQEAIEKAK